MGFLSRFRSGDDDGDDSPDKYQVIARDHNGRAAPTPDDVGSGEWVYETSPPSKEQFRFDYGEYLNPSYKYACLPLDGGALQFDDPQWSISPERDPTDEMPPWARQLQSQIAESGDRPPEDLQTQLIHAIAKENGPAAALNEWKEMRALENGEKQPRSLSESVNDPTNPKEIAGRSLLKMSEGYSTFGEMFQDVMGGAMMGAVGPTAGADPAAQQSQQPAAQQPPSSSTPTPTPAPTVPADGPTDSSTSAPASTDATERSSSLRAQFGDDATTDATAADPNPATAARTSASTPEDDPVHDPTTATELWDDDRYSYNDLQAIAARYDYPEKVVGATKDDLREHIEAELFASDDADAEADAPTVTVDGEEPGGYGDPGTESRKGMTASPEDADGAQTGAGVTAGGVPDDEDDEHAEAAPIEAQAPEGTEGSQ